MKFLPIALIFLVSVSCKERTKSNTEATPVDRKILREGEPYEPILNVEKYDAPKSMIGRRALAWEIADKVLADVSIGKGDENSDFKPDAEAKVAAWQTYYTSNEFIWMFRSLYGDLGKDNHLQYDGDKMVLQNGFPVGKDFCPEKMHPIFSRNVLQDLGYPFADGRYEKRLAQFKTIEQIRGVSGNGFTQFSPGIIYHYLLNYKKVLMCNSIVDKISRTDEGPTRRNFSYCMDSEFPSGHENAYKDWTGDLSRCEIKNPLGTYLLKYTTDQIGGAVAIKSTWQQEESSNSEVAYFDTSAEGLTKNLADGEWKAAGLKKLSELPSNSIYQIEVMKAGNSVKHALTGLHILTKDRREWVWITLWWSPDPTSDFGADRPAHLANVNKPIWKNYKMCTVTSYEEWDPDPAGKISQPSLKAAIAAMHKYDPQYTWCSNPYIEHGKGNTRTNCIGCHQHAGTKANPDDVFLDDPTDPNNAQRRAKYPNHGRSRVRHNFPADYLWSFSDNPDFFNLSILNTVEEFRKTETEPPQ
ncbi:MAG: hypothetical protein AB7T49_15155 [Oligoflexales bacterium]